ncbi:hypothetical protein [Streptomyces aureocirculatus]|uniref:hypothetical protein n=1 Tax=Streptomyces aureocirculatus TaxID=67275 RepID=UPI000A7FC957|nr:hypothetical protein [Streptomyces aureocirculatus]
MRDVTDPLRMFVVPGAALLDVQQNSGNACVWCPRTLRPGQGIALGGSGNWLPHACRDCYDAQTRPCSRIATANGHVALRGCCDRRFPSLGVSLS